MAHALELIDIRKTFGGLVALDTVSLQLEAGAVHGVLGENGAGKSTLMNIAYGLLRPDAGEIRVARRQTSSARSYAGFPSPARAIAAGIGMVHQHFMLAGAMTVLDNILLGDRRAPGWLNRKQSADKLNELARVIGLPIEPFARVESLSVGQQQRVEILKALWRDVNVLILDEPTAVLTPVETEQLFASVNRLREQGKSIVFISHKLREVKNICDNLTVLRKGKIVWQGKAGQVSEVELAREMIGQDVKLVSLAQTTVQAANEKRAPDPGTPTLQLSNISAAPLQNVSLTIAPGRILGIAGVDGNGQQELAEIVTGLRLPASGQITLAGQDVTRWNLKQRLAEGLAHIPNDRKREALVTTMSITENAALKHHDRPPFSRAGLLAWKTLRASAKRLTGLFDIRAASIQTPVGTLSGGNQQKVVLARELAIQAPRLIVAMNPVRGLDIAAANFVYRQLLEARQAGAAILLISSELDELLNLCDQIAVLYQGRLTPTNFPQTDRRTIGQLMAGIAPSGVAASAAH